MATLVRRSEELLTVLLGIKRSREGWRLTAQVFRGDKKLSNSVSMPLSALGHTPKVRSKRGHQMCFPQPKAPPRLSALFFEASQQANPEEAIWLQIGYGADVLGAFPWEGLIGQELNQTFLRIPNFARNTYIHPRDQEPFAICAATPLAKGSPDWRPALHQLLSELEWPNPVVLYLSERQAHYFQSEDALSEKYPHLDISLAPLPDRNGAPARERFISEQDRVTNPWLSWIIEDLNSRFKGRAHAVHFVCSGYSQNEKGALALPTSPHVDDDENWARFVGVPEFARFADQIHCQIIGLSALGASRWREGLRLFANELSWKRPGPIVLDQGNGSANRAYHCLLSGDAFDTSTITDIVFSAHPKAILADVPDMTMTRQAQSTRSMRADFSAEMAFLEAFSIEPESTLPEDAPLPDELLQVMDRLSSARPKSILRSAQDRGTLNALKFLKSLPVGKGAK